MRPSEKDAKTYQDLMRLLPDVATIKLWWAVNEDGDPKYIQRILLCGHDGGELIEADVDDLDDQVIGLLSEEIDPGADVKERLEAALLILNWLDPRLLPEEDGASVVALPSASHVGDNLPTDWRLE